MTTFANITFTLAFCVSSMQVSGQRTPQPLSHPLNWVDLTEVRTSSPLSVLHERKDLFGLGSSDSMHLASVERDVLGQSHFHFDQYHQGVRVEHGKYMVHQQNNGDLYLANGILYRGPSMTATPVLSASDAINRALAAVPARVYFWEVPFWEETIQKRTGKSDASYYPVPELVFAPLSTEDLLTGASLHLAYRVDVRAHIPMVEKRLYIDAATGAVIRDLPLTSGCSSAIVNTNYYGTHLIKTTQDGPSYRLLNDCLPGGGNVHVRDWGGAGTQVPPPSPEEITSSDNYWPSEVQIFGASTQYAIEETDDYFKDIHDRDAYDDNSGDLDVYINAIYLDDDGNPYTSNALYHGDGVMTVGLGSPDYDFPDPGCISSDPLEDALNTFDIIGHEYGHAIDASEADLAYTGESGALDESFADIYGCMVELHAQNHMDWRIGDERCTGHLRDLSDPNDKNDPDTYGGTYWASTCGGCSDNGGVHTNSGVQNFWFYLLSHGGSGSNDNGSTYEIEAIQADHSRRIAYRSHTEYLTSGSNYAQARAGAIQAAEDLYGACSDKQLQTANAWHAVGVGPWWYNADITVSNNGSQPVEHTYCVMGTLTSPEAGEAATMTNGAWEYRATNKVLLQPGFHATGAAGLTFIAKAQSCATFP